MIQVPPHIFWPGFIIALLLIPIGSGAAIVIAATSDAGPQVIPDYYQKAVEFDNGPAKPNPYLLDSPTLQEDSSPATEIEAVEPDDNR